MCINTILSWFNKPDPVPIPIPTGKKKIAVLTGINNYGGGNNLSGCLNDIDDVAKKLNAEFPGFIINKYKDAQVVGDFIYSKIKEAFLSCVAGDEVYWHYSGHGTQIPSPLEANGYHEALYLKDGPFIDDRIQELLTFKPAGVKFTAKFDSCFSGDMLRDLRLGLNGTLVKNRFYQMPSVPVMHNVITHFAKSLDVSDCVVISGCGEEQTSADAFINGRFNGAFTYFDNLSYDAIATFNDEMKKLHGYLPGGGYDQNPTIDGDLNRFKEIVFS